MQKVFWALLSSIILFGCLKNPTSTQTCGYSDSQTVAPDSEVQKVKAYVDLNHINAQQHASGFYYVIHDQGVGAFVSNLCSAITVTYRGTFTNGAVFDSTATNATAVFQLGSLIVGWQKAIPLINKGGKITLYIPPSLGYGQKDATDNQGHVIIPANSILIFDIDVLDISG